MHKYLQNSKSISYPLEDFFSNVINSWNISNLGLATLPLVHYLLPSLLVQMCGFIEQKYDSMIWEIGYLEHKHRRDVSNTYHSGSIDIQKYSNFCNNILNETLKDKDFKLIKCTNYIYKKILKNTKNILKNSDINNELTDCNTYIGHVYQTCKNKGNKKEIEVLLDATRVQRNKIAHFRNFYNMKNIHYLHTKDFNYIEGFAVLIALDTVLIEMFKGYKTRHFL